MSLQELSLGQQSPVAALSVTNPHDGQKESISLNLESCWSYKGPQTPQMQPSRPMAQASQSKLARMRNKN